MLQNVIVLHRFFRFVMKCMCCCLRSVHSLYTSQSATMHSRSEPSSHHVMFSQAVSVVNRANAQNNHKTFLLGQVFMNGIFPSSTFPLFCEWKTTGNVLGKTLGILKRRLAKRTRAPPSVVKPRLWLAATSREVSFIRKDKEKKFELLKEKIHQSKSSELSEHPTARRAS